MISRILLTILLAATMITAFAVVYVRHYHRQLYVALSQAEHTRDELNIEFGRLQLEQATWSESNRVDQIARNRLGMGFPQSTDIVVVQP